MPSSGMKYLNYLNLSLPKQSSDPNHWADHIEFFCFISQEGKISLDQIVSRFLEENSNEVRTAIQGIVDEDEFNQILSYNDQSDDTYEDSVSNDLQDDSALGDKIPPKIMGFFDLLKSRSDSFGLAYPFTTGHNEISLKDNLTGLQQLYIILLCSSLLRLATESGRNKLGHNFEELCGPAFKKLMPQNAEIHFFGSGGDINCSTENVDSIIKGRFYEKVLTLCQKLSVSPSQDFTLANAGMHNVGDGGVDWVGINNFEDKKSSQPVFFGQCACGSDWVDKQFDAVILKWRNYIQFKNGYLTYHFIPRSFRKEKLNWYDPTEIYDVVLIDRHRIVELLKNEEGLNNMISCIYANFLNEVSMNKIDAFT